MRALVTGATGFIGRRLLRQLTNPVVLSRNPEKAKKILGSVEVYRWIPDQESPPKEAFNGVDVVFNLAGEPIVSGRWTESKKKRIFDSRVGGTRNLVSAIEGLGKRPKTLVSASAIGCYGSRGEEILDEADSPGDDFLAKLCKAWEGEALRAAQFGVRVVIPRFGIVLGEEGGALKKMLFPFKLGLGGRVGNGKQWVSWIHADDVVGIMMHAVSREDIKGPINAVTAAPVRNEEFTKVLAQTLHRPASLPVPAFLLKIVMGEMSTVLLSSQRVIPRVADRAGYKFLYPKLELALEAILGKK
ncbi:MAG: TIGR01777 family protein [Deltaproteobacteria bacterium]|nr:TIGR01777 family protein [Deltaproteobacteria bacterium]